MFNVGLLFGVCITTYLCVLCGWFDRQIHAVMSFAGSLLLLILALWYFHKDLDIKPTGINCISGQIIILDKLSESE